MSEARLLDLSEADYHADKIAEVPTLSASMAHTLTNESAAHAYLYHPKLGGKKREATKATDTGSLIHTLVLGEGSEIEVIDANAWRTDAAKAARDAAREAHKIPVLSAKYNEAKIVAQRLKDRIKEYGYDLSDGLTEQAVSWTEEAEAGTVLCRGLMDKLWLEDGQIIDFKTIKSAKPETCARHMIDYGYAIQEAAYKSAVVALRPELAGRVQMTFLFCETEPPYCVTPATTMGAMREIGERRWERAVDLWATCLTLDNWPGYVEDTTRLDAPVWAVAKELEEDL